MDKIAFFNLAIIDKKVNIFFDVKGFYLKKSKN